MRTLQLVTTRQRRGAEVFASDLADALCSRGHQAIVVGLGRPPENSLQPQLAATADLTRVGVARLDFRRILELARLFRKENPDVIQANGGYAVKYAVLARKAARGKWPIVYCNIGLSSDWLRFPGQRQWTRWLINQTQMTAAVSEASRRDLIDTYALPEEVVRVVRRGLATEPIYTRQEGRLRLSEAGVPSPAPVMLHVGSFSEEKNHEGLLRIHRLVQQHVPDVQLVLVGDGSLRDEIQEKATVGVHLLGVRTDVSTLMAGADVFVLPSHTEGIPGVILEASVQAIPTVAYDIGGIPEVVRDRETGRLIPSGDEKGAAEAVVSLLESPDLNNQYGRSARAYVTAEYDIERSVDAFEKLYFDVLSEKSCSRSGREISLSGSD
jgi:L-malate glycosyltransferase